MSFLKKYYKLLVSAAHGIFLFIIMWMVTNSPWSSAVDETVLTRVNSWRSNLFGNDLHYDHSFVFVNVSKDLKMVSDPAEYGEFPITDRTKLASFLKILADNNNRHYFALCDIFLEYPTDDDSLLLSEVKRCKNILFPYHLNGDSIQEPCIPVPAALSDYVTYTGNFSKFKLVYNKTIKTTPLILLEQLDERKYPSRFFEFRSVFPRYYVKPSHLLESKKYPYFNLGELLMLSEEPTFYDQFLKDKFIVIGNFETDIHYTPAGNMPGPLILLNSYLTIRNEQKASWFWALFMICGLSYISYLLFFKKVKPPNVGKRPWLDLFMHFFVNSYFSFAGICLLLVLISTFIFKVQPNVSAVLTYLILVNFFKEFYKKHFQKEEPKPTA